MLLPGIKLVILKLLMNVFDMRYNLRQNKANILGGIFLFVFCLVFFSKQQRAEEMNSSVTLLRSLAL